MNGQTPKRPWWWPGVELAGQITGWILGPLLVALFVGRWLDRELGTKPWFLLGLILLAFTISSFGIAHHAIASMKKIEREERQKKNTKHTDDRK